MMMHSVLLFLDIGGPEMMLILVACLLLFGGQKLPELARGLGKGIRDFKDAANGVKDDLQESMNKLQDDKFLSSGSSNSSGTLVDQHSNPYPVNEVQPVNAAAEQLHQPGEQHIQDQIQHQQPLLDNHTIPYSPSEPLAAHAPLVDKNAVPYESTQLGSGSENTEASHGSADHTK